MCSGMRKGRRERGSERSREEFCVCVRECVCVWSSFLEKASLYVWNRREKQKRYKEEIV